MSQVLCVALAMWVLVELSFEDKDKKKDDSDERKPLFSRHYRSHVVPPRIRFCRTRTQN